MFMDAYMRVYIIDISSSHQSTHPHHHHHQDPSLLLLNGELVAKWHLDGLMEEAGVALQDKGKVRSMCRCSLVVCVCTPNSWAA